LIPSVYCEEWWKLVYSIPKGENPVADDQTGQFAHKGQSGPVFFLYGNFGGKTERTCTVLYGKSIFLPILMTISLTARNSASIPKAP
jgi:hypothetical protein